MPMGSLGSGTFGPDPFANGAGTTPYNSDPFQPTAPPSTVPMGQTLAGMRTAGLGTPMQRMNGQPSQANFLTSMYQRMFGRAPDNAGLNFWQGQMQNGMGIGDLINAFRHSQEFTARQQAQPMQMGTGGPLMSAPMRQPQPQMPAPTGFGGLGGLGGYTPAPPPPGSFGRGIYDAQQRGDPNSVYY